jgi:endonuclease-3
MEKTTVKEILLRFQKHNPDPKIELEYLNPFTLIVAVLLSAQSTDVGVNKATKTLFELASTPEKMLNLGEEKLKDYIKTIGLYNNKAKNIIALSQKLVDDNKQVIPNDFDYLITLPGIGRKSANVILSSLFKEKRIAVDTHVFRVSNRIGLVKANDVLKTEIELLNITPDEFLPRVHHWLVLHGRYICKAKKPKCSECIINDLCEFNEKTL